MVLKKDDNSIKIDNKDNKTAVLLISHGSRLPYGKEVITNLADMYRETTNYIVGVGYMEVGEPDISTAIDELVDGSEIERIIAVPVFLAHGVHTKKDIPKILGLEIEETALNDEKSSKHHHEHHNHHNNSHQSHHKHHKHNHDDDHHNHHPNHHNHHHDHENNETKFKGEIIYTDPLGADPLVLEIIKKRVSEAL